jgi:hypothetical protein
MYLAIAEFVFIPFFSGFAIWSVVYLFSKREYLAGHKIENVDKFIVRAIIFIGLMHFLIFLIHTLSEGVDIKRAFGEYWFGFWIYPITYFGLTQLLWFRKIRENRAVRIILAVWFFVVIYLETFIILASSFNLNFTHVSQSLELLSYFALNLVITSLIFVTLVVSGLEIKAWICNKKP